MVKNMADFCIIFHFYATSVSPSGKTEEGKQSRVAPPGFISFTFYSGEYKKAEFGKCIFFNDSISYTDLFNYILNHKHVVPTALLMSL